MTYLEMLRCGKNKKSPKGPQGQECERKAEHDGPHSCASEDMKWTIFWGDK